MTIRVSFSLDEIEDADLVTWLQAQNGNRSEAIRDALRAGRHHRPVQGEGAVSAEALRRIIREELANVSIAAPVENGGDEGLEEDPELVTALEDMF